MPPPTAPHPLHYEKFRSIPRPIRSIMKNSPPYHASVAPLRKIPIQSTLQSLHCEKFRSISRFSRSIAKNSAPIHASVAPLRKIPIHISLLRSIAQTSEPYPPSVPPLRKIPIHITPHSLHSEKFQY